MRGSLVLVIISPLLLGATCIQGEFERDPDEVEPTLPLATRFIPPELNRELLAPNGEAFQYDARSVLSALSGSTDLWIARSGAGPGFQPSAFTGIAPTCIGRPDVRADLHPTLRSSCYLEALELVEGSRLRARIHLGGGWVETLEQPLEPIFRDSDRDGLNDALETLLGTHPANADSDSDTVPDGSDADPLAAPRPVRGVDPRQQDLVRLALEDAMGCRKGRPFIVIGPASARVALNRPCMTIYLDERWQIAAERSLPLPVNGTLPVGPAVRRELARAGALQRVRVELRGGPKEATVRVISAQGSIIKTFMHTREGWFPTGKRVELARVPAEWRGLSRASSRPASR